MSKGLTPKSAKFSLAMQISHEFIKVIRSDLNSGRSSGDIRVVLIDAIETPKRNLAKSVILFLLSSIVVASTSSNSAISVKTPFLEITFPEIYVVFVAAVAWLGAVISTMQVLVLLMVQVKFDQMPRVSEFFLSARMALSGGEHFDLVSPIRSGHLHRLSAIYIRSLGFLQLCMYLIFLLPIGGAYIYLISEAFGLMRGDSEVFFVWPLAISSIILMLMSVFIFIGHFVPVGISPDTERIRWIFLAKATQTGRVHHNFRRWTKAD